MLWIACPTRCALFLTGIKTLKNGLSIFFFHYAYYFFSRLFSPAIPLKCDRGRVFLPDIFIKAEVQRSKFKSRVGPIKTHHPIVQKLCFYSKGFFLPHALFINRPTGNILSRK